jgi:thymidylate kinase
MDPASAQVDHRASSRTQPALVSFSGIDGAGKTTQINNLVSWLEQAGLRVRLVAFWDDVATLRRLRENTGHALFKGEKGVGSPDKPVNRRDKNVQSWYMVPIRMGLSALDAAGLMRVIRGIRRRADADVIIFDRYLYDQVANLDVRKNVAGGYARLLLKVIPHPDVAYLLDADPVLARARKPEYPLDFLIANRERYLAISKMAGMKVIHAGSPEEVRSSVLSEFRKKLAPYRQGPASEILTDM